METRASLSRISSQTLSCAVRSRALQKDEYVEAVRDVKLLLDGKNKELADELEQRMWQFAEKENYELAAKYRDLRETVLALGEHQKWRQRLTATLI